MTFDAGGRRRLGALLGERVIDLPELVGHPAFPASMESLIRRNGGTVLDAARSALERSDAVDAVVDEPRLLVPVLPASLRSSDAEDGTRPIIGPGASVSWPAGSGLLHLAPRLVALLRRQLEGAGPAEAEAAFFGYTILVEWVVRGADGDTAASTALPMSLGPCIATREDLEPSAAAVEVRIDGRRWAREPVGAALTALARSASAASYRGPLEAGEAFASEPLVAEPIRVLPGARVEVTLEGIGTLDVPVGRAA